VDVKVRRDESPYGLPLPEEFRELLRQDKVGNRVFHGMAAGKQRTLLYIIGKGKNSDQKIERSIIVTEHLKKNRGKIDYRRLTEELRKGRSKKLF